ncbi:transcription factor TFIIIB component B'' homolog [Pollicipes pollicipes]|uniref:transcription factor TFIIIB component B'' homolog n=1 Tax=Pollicipes pollicipes TaxID=41117 RepID=UPI00188568C4|nr:transcription factor TFIIIB component B'' homolog [Pollicipes pollicipes]
MMMKDLIYWNPDTEAMSNSKEKPARRGRTRRDSASSVTSSRTDATAEDSASQRPDDPEPDPELEPEPDPEPTPADEEEPEDAMPVPQLKVGPDGSIVVDEQSLVVKTSQQRQRDQELSSELVRDLTGSRISFNGYRQRRQINEWSIKETARFYKALSTVGTDFSIMQQLFPKRSRVDLKKKFKKEERKNPHLVERALTEDMQYDLTIFDNDGHCASAWACSC